ncbi:MAG TPA: tRNA uridine-5-carboxymethylaminomethyl(34) synthesis enzyme MnmG [Phycisphaerales bacterium]|nr:tRNA uridine-5-carboxymethylaminomethyl(34) synthesis enzyme MnmG [Phycisphaerales bacterium]
MRSEYQIIVIGGGHAGAEAAWAAANLLREPHSVALVTANPSRIGAMSCNPAIGGLAKGQLVREIDALGGLMGLAADASGIMFKMLNTSRGPAVRGPRCQCDKDAYAAEVQRLISSRVEIDVIAGRVDEFLLEGDRVAGVRIFPPESRAPLPVTSICAAATELESRAGDLQFEQAETPSELRAAATVLTTGTFMRGLMHTGETKTPGGRFGEAPAIGISKTLMDLGFELGRLKTGTPPRISKDSIDWANLPEQVGDVEPVPFSDLSEPEHFPALAQHTCRMTHTTHEIHTLIRANLHRAPMFTGQIDGSGPRYCPSIEDKVERFDRDQHTVFLEPEGLDSDWVYCNGISTSLPGDVQRAMVRLMPGCAQAKILRLGYAVEYDVVRPHQIRATGETKRLAGLFLAGQINGTSGYEEAAAQGLVAGVNAVRSLRGQDAWMLGRDEAYIGVLMDDLVTKTPTEPYRMFTSRAEHRLLLRADNAADRLTPKAQEIGLLSGELGERRIKRFRQRQDQIARLNVEIDSRRIGGVPLSKVLKRQEYSEHDLLDDLAGTYDPGVVRTVLADRIYSDYIVRQRNEIRRHRDLEQRALPDWLNYEQIEGLRAEAAEALARYCPSTFGQASRLEGVTPADLSLVAVYVRRGRRVHGVSP